MGWIWFRNSVLVSCTLTGKFLNMLCTNIAHQSQSPELILGLQQTSTRTFDTYIHFTQTFLFTKSESPPNLPFFSQQVFNWCCWWFSWFNKESMKMPARLLLSLVWICQQFTNHNSKFLRLAFSLKIRQNYANFLFSFQMYFSPRDYRYYQDLQKEWLIASRTAYIDCY